MATENPNELDRAEAERMIDEERGTALDWLELPTFLELEKGRVIEYPDRTWVAEIIEMLKTDGQAQGLEIALTMPLRQANTTLKKPAKGRNASKITEEVEDMLFRPPTENGMQTPFDVVIGQMTFASAVCRTFHERVWTRTPNDKLGYSKIAWRPPASCELIRDRQNGELQGFKQFIDYEAPYRRDPHVDWRGYIEVPQNRAVIHINNQHRDPLYGWSDLAVAHWAWNLKKMAFHLWTVFLRRLATPWVLAYGADPADATKNAKQIAGLMSGGVAGVTRPNADAKMFDVLDAAGQGSDQFTKLIGYLDGMMSQSALAGWMDLAGAASQSGAGSYALSADQSGLYLQSRHGAARELMATVNMQIIRPFVRVNYGPDAPVPTLVMEKIGSDQVAKAIELLTALGAGQNLQVPQGFLHLLIERVAAYLDLPDDQVRKMIDEAAKQAREEAARAAVPLPDPNSPEGQLQDMVAGAVGAVSAGAPPPTDPPDPNEEQVAA